MSKIKYTVDNHFFDVIDNEIKAYMLGFYLTDGCNYEDKHTIKLDVTEEDSYILERFKNEINYTGEIRKYTYKNDISKDGKYHTMCRLMFNSIQISKQLALKGCIANKSLKGKYVPNGTIPDYLMNHFIRGLIDGDGGLSFWEDNPITHHRKFQLNFCSTIDSVQKLANYLSKRFNCSPSIVDRHKDRNNNNLQLCIDGNRVVKSICDWLYKDATIYLNRKYDKYIILTEEIARVDNDKKLYGNAYARKKVINTTTNNIYESVSAAARAIGKATSYITIRCQQHKDGWMYLNDYQLGGFIC